MVALDRLEMLRPPNADRCVGPALCLAALDFWYGGDDRSVGSGECELADRR
jgi:hypothetical protein